MIIMGDNTAEDVDMIEVPVAMEMEAALITGMIIRSVELAVVKDNGTFIIIEGMDKITHIEVNADSGMEMTQITADNRDRNSDGQGNSNQGRRWDNNNRGQGHSDRGRGRRWNPNQQYHDPGYQQESQYQNPNHYRPPPMGHQYRYPIPYGQYSYRQQQQQYQSQMPTPSQQATNICQLCHSQGHYNYQCQFAGDFMAHTQKAFNQGRSYSHQDPNHGEWSQGNNDNNDPNGQPFQ